MSGLINMGNQFTFNAGFEEGLKTGMQKEVTREDALKIVAELKVKHDLSALEIGKAAALVRIPLGNPR